MQKQITVADMAPHIHVFERGNNKVAKLSEWMITWIQNAIMTCKVHPDDKLPSKGELAYHIGVSLGTMQNVFRIVEDKGLIYSKQKLGSFIAGSVPLVVPTKLTSQRELAVEKIKQYLINKNYKIGDALISTRKLAREINFSPATIRIAINTLITNNVLTQQDKLFIIKNLDYELKSIEIRTLSEKITDELLKLINNNYSDGDKLPSNKQLAKKYGVSVKTIYDAIKILSKSGHLISRRGTYGTIVVKSDIKPNLYFYEKAELKIKHFIIKKCKVGTKLPSIKELALLLQVSTKTVKKALDNLTYDGYVTSTRGRLGGTFVTDIPQNKNEAYKWLALNPDFIVGT